ncbi:hypothetical protein FRC07_002721 [Ceratobasidium sp. 392]|nr:hypothetical protein FRC07_002721 [Ceratobasidium sp. 392]
MPQPATNEPAQNSGATERKDAISSKARVNIKRHPKFCFDNTLIAIQIEDTLFNVHKYQLMKSTTFSDMFAIADESENDQTTGEGSSLDHPIVMQGVSASDFECLMTVLYARQSYVPPSHFSSHQPDPEASLIIPAFRLANMWNFTELCAYLGPLAERVLSDVDKIVFAREFKVDEWLAPAHIKLCLREEKITTQEASKLGLDSLLFILRFREDNRRNMDGITAQCSGCGSNGRCSYSGHVLTVAGITSMPGEDQVKKAVQDWLDKGCNMEKTQPRSFSRHPKFFFDNTLVAIGIENTLFNVHKYQLMKSTTFSDMFALADASKNGETTPEGSSPDRPIVMEGVSASDFESLMTVLYASHFSAHQPEPEAALIIPAFRLAKMWDFTELCSYLMPLAEKVLNDADKIAFAREFNVNEWIVPAHVSLCLREKKLTTQEAKKLGIDTGDGQHGQPPDVTRHSKFFFDNTLIALRIENTLFNVHKYQLMKSTCFSDLFAAADASGGKRASKEGYSPENPIVLHEVTAADFECLMTVLYASHFSTNHPDPEASLIVPAFRLAHKWSFAQLCDYLKPLAERVLNDVDKVTFAREFSVTEWLLPAHVKLCLRSERLTTQEAEKLGLNSTLFISRFRDEYHPKDATVSIKCPDGCDLATCQKCGKELQKESRQLPSESEATEKVKAWLDNGCVLSD